MKNPVVRGRYARIAPSQGPTGLAEMEAFLDDLMTRDAVAFVWFLNQWNLLGWRY